MNPLHQVYGDKTVATDLLYEKKAAFLNLPLFTVALRRLLRALDLDLGPAAQGVLHPGLRRGRRSGRAGTASPRASASRSSPSRSRRRAIYWFKSLEYHWFSTMYGVWYFSDCVRGALSLGVIIMLWLYKRGDFKGILKTDHLWAIGQLMLTFTVFWGYISFDQYFLIWNANVPEETFWYNIREFGDWWYVSLFLVFGNFLLPFLLLLSYRYKVTHRTIRRIAYFILLVIFVDIAYNILPALKDAQGNPLPFFSLRLLWSADLASSGWGASASPPTCGACRRRS